MDDDQTALVEAIGHFRLSLNSRKYLDLYETFVVPYLTQNLVSVSVSDKFGYSCSFGNNLFSLICDSNVVGTVVLIDSLYMLNTQLSVNETLHINSIGTKRKLTNEDSSMLWHRHLGHISKQRIKRLVSDRILDPLDLANFKVCVECIKGK